MTYKDKVLNAIQYMYGSTKKEAEKLYRKLSDESRNLLVKGFEQNAKKSFYAD